MDIEEYRNIKIEEDFNEEVEVSLVRARFCGRYVGEVRVVILNRTMYCTIDKIALIIGPVIFEKEMNEWGLASKLLQEAMNIAKKLGFEKTVRIP